MLVLSRKRGETIVIDGDITVSVIAIEGSRVRLGFSAPPEVPILRGELQPRDEWTPLTQPGLISERRTDFLDVPLLSSDAGSPLSPAAF